MLLLTLAADAWDRIVSHFALNWQAYAAFAALLSPWIALAGVVAGLRHARRQLQATIDIANQQLEANRNTGERQIRAAVIAANRQKWIDELRSELAHLIGLLPAAHGIRLDSVNAINSQALLRDMNFHHAKISLLINPQECDCSKLGDIVDRSVAHASESLRKTTINRDVLTHDMNEIVSVAQQVFAERWEKIRSLE
jgi:hypothetical protein